MPHEVVMPALGMAQDTGVIVAWRKAVGDAVAEGDVLMEVETDKAVMEVEAQASGVVSELRVGAGEEVPVGSTVAVIASPSDSRASTPSEAPPADVGVAPPEETAVEAAKAPTDPAEKPAPAAPVSAPAPPRSKRSGEVRILASPKARRLARERGLDLRRLVAAGRAQPYHTADLEALEDGAGAVTLALACASGEAFDALLAWLDPDAGRNSAAVLAAFAAGAHRAATGAESVVVRVEAPGAEPVTYVDADQFGLRSVEPAATPPAPDLVLHDLTSARLATVGPWGAEAATLVVARSGDRISASLSARSKALDATCLLASLDAFAGRLQEPLRHLL